MNLSEGRSALRRRRSDGSFQNADLNEFLRAAELDIYSRMAWPFLRRSHRWTTAAQGSLGAVDVTNGSRLVTLSSGTFPDGIVGPSVIIGGFFHTVRYVEDATTIVLDRAYSGDTDTNLTISINYNEVALPRGASSMVQAVLLQSGNSVYDLCSVSQRDIVQLTPDSTGRPTHFCLDRMASLPAPQLAMAATLSGTSSGYIADGTYSYWFSYFHPQSGLESPLSPSKSVAFASSTNDLTASLGKDHSSENQQDAPHGFLFRVYRSRAGGSEAFLVREEAPSDPAATSYSFNDTSNDIELDIPAAEGASAPMLRLWPIPDDEYDLEIVYTAEPKGMVEDQDVPLMDGRWHHLVLDGAEAMMLESADEQGRANQARMRYEAGIARMIKANKINRQHVGQVGGSRSRRVRSPKTAADWMWSGS